MEYLAYGSNMLTARLRRRVPGARDPRVVELPGYEVRYRKVSKDGSAKCDLVPSVGTTSYGVVFDIDPAEKPRLEYAEGVGNGYHEERLGIQVDGRELQPFVYVADRSHVREGLAPYGWYRDVVVCGAREHHLPADYVEKQLSVPAVPDPDKGRNSRERAYLQRS